MHNPKVVHRRVLSVLSLTAIVLSALPSIESSSAAPDKFKVEELIAKHLDSIGSAQARAAVKTRIISGSSQVTFLTTPLGQATGRAVLASEGIKSLLGMSFPSPVYPREHLGFDGAHFIAAFVLPGQRSALGSFLMTHSVIFKQGLMGGTLSSAWPLLDVATRSPQLEYVGTRTIENHALHEMKYLPRGGSDLQIKLFFDPETFQHVRTEYERVIAGETGDRSMLAGVTRETRFKMIEEFSDFKKEGELVLPHGYKIRLTTDTQSGTFSADWALKLTQFDFNQPIDPNSFNIAAD